MTVIDKQTWPRRAIYDFFAPMSDPFYTLTFPVDVTALRAWCRGKGLPFYPAMVYAVTRAMEAEEAFRYYDEHIEVRDPLDRQFYHAFSEIYQVPMSDQIFVAQSNVIRRLASHGPCVIVGRCADMVLADSVNLFIYSKMKDRVKRMLRLEGGSDEKEMERRIREVDRKRRDYYQYYTGNTWGRAQNYHLCLESGLVGVDGCLRAVIAYLGELGGGEA